MPAPWLPALETNQGAISVAALALALAAFIWELYRANTQRQRELEEEIEDAISLIEELEQFVTDDVIDLPDADEGTGEISPIELIATALRALAVAHVKKPALSLPLLRAAKIAELVDAMSAKELVAEAEDLSNTLSCLKRTVEDALKAARRRVVFRRRERRKLDKALAGPLMLRRGRRT